MGREDCYNKRKPGKVSIPPRSCATLLLFLLVLFANACKKEVAPPPVERVRTVKTVVVGELAGGQARRFPGTVNAVETSSVSFEAGGLVQRVRVDIGDRIKKGQPLAALTRMGCRGLAPKHRKSPMLAAHGSLWRIELGESSAHGRWGLPENPDP